MAAPTRGISGHNGLTIFLAAHARSALVTRCRVQQSRGPPAIVRCTVAGCTPGRPALAPGAGISVVAEAKELIFVDSDAARRCHDIMQELMRLVEA